MSDAEEGRHGQPPKQAPQAGRTPVPDPIRGGEAAEPSGSGGGEVPAAGPHADPSLINPDATPGTGALPAPGEQNATDSTSG